MVDHGIKPCYIFDGKPPDLKGGVVSPILSFTHMSSPPAPAPPPLPPHEDQQGNVLGLGCGAEF